MAVTYGYFNSINGDRKYNADQMSDYFRGIVNEGVFQHLNGGLAVVAGTGMEVTVATGRAIVQNKWVQNDAAFPLTIEAASDTYGRKDAVVIRLSYTNRAISIVVKTGTPSASPAAPSLTRSSTTYEMALAYVNVSAGATSVTVTDKRSDTTVCGWATVAQETSGEVDQMLNDMKTGFDGVEYSSPAAMVQGCDEKIASVSQCKNLCGMKTDVLYPVPNIKDSYITMSTSDGSTMTNNYFYLYCYGKDKQQLSGNRGYYKFVAGNSSYTHHVYSDLDVYYVRWSADYSVPLQVEIGQTATTYEAYWGNAKYLNGLEPKIETIEEDVSDIAEDVNSINDLIGDAAGAYNLVGAINDHKYLKASNCVVYDDVEAYRTSDPISITESTEYVVGLFNDKNAPTHEFNAITVCFYDASNNGMMSYSVYSSDYTHDNCTWVNGFVKFTTPSGAKTLRIGANDSASPFKWFLATASSSNLYAASNEIKQSKISENDELQGKIIAVFGDSIMGNTRNKTATPEYISEATGATVLNFGFGGCRMSVHSGDWDKCSMYRLADDIYNESFTDLVSAVTTGWSGMPGYFKDTVAWLAACDFSKVDAILIAYGTNDYRETTSVLDNNNDKFDTSTVCGALRYSIKQILSKYPMIQILVTCPVFRTFFQEGTTTPDEYSDTKDWGSGTLLQYAEAYKQACADMNVPFLDLYHETSFNPYTRLYFFPEDDGTHPNEKGRERIGTVIGGRFKNLLRSN